MNVYKVSNGAESANFSKAVIDELKRLNMIVSQGSTTVRENVRVFHYAANPRPRDTGRGKW
jgi:hypothetical protein